MVLLVLVSIVLMTFDQRHSHLDTIRSAISVALWPLQQAVHLPFAAWQWGSENLTLHSTLLQENDTLRRENLLLNARLQKFASLRAENERLRELLQSAHQVADRVLIAELLAFDPDPYRRRVVVNKGSRHGAYRGQPVLDAHGVMGQVLLTNPLASEVLLITDPEHALPVQVNRNGLRAIASGTGARSDLDLPHLPNTADIRPGDLLVTSGLDGRFPRGYPVAEVSEVVREPGQHFLSIRAVPLAHLERNREVLLVWPAEEEGPASLETAPASDELAAEEAAIPADSTPEGGHE